MYGELIHVGGGARVYKSDGHGMIMKLDDFGNVTVMAGGVEMGQGFEVSLSLAAGGPQGMPNRRSIWALTWVPRPSLKRPPEASTFS